MAMKTQKKRYQPPVVRSESLTTPSAQLICVTGPGPDENGCFTGEEFCIPDGRCIACGDPCGEA